jgi:CubicO group peptidase (beta-lactamase class C family)
VRGGVDAAAQAALDRWLDDQVQQGLLGAAQYALARDGRIVATGHSGAADDDTTFLLFSATKTIVATAVLPLLASGRLELTAPVSRYIAEFTGHGKERVTVLQLLTMQGGFPQAPLGPDQWATSAGRRAAFAAWRTDWKPGTATEYHPVSAHWVIAELLETLTGRNFVDVVHDTVVRPAGGTDVLGVPSAAPAPVRVHGTRSPDHALAEYYGHPDLVPVASVQPDALLSLNNPLAQAAAIPGGGGISTSRDIALVYQAMLHNPGGMLPAAWLADAIGTIRNGSVSRSDGLPANRTITGVVAGNDGFAAHRWFPDAPRAFGHHGAGGQLCWLEPDSGASFCFLHDTLHQDPIAEHRRCREVNALALACLA